VNALSFVFQVFYRVEEHRVARPAGIRRSDFQRRLHRHRSQLFANAAGSALGALQDLYIALVGNDVAAAVTEVSSAIGQVGVQHVVCGTARNDRAALA
jgi:hypothetical protein